MKLTRPQSNPGPPKNHPRLSIVAIMLLVMLPSALPLAHADDREDRKKLKDGDSIEVEVSAAKFIDEKKADAADATENQAQEEPMRVTLSHVAYNRDRSLFVGYYQHGWFEMVSLHDAKTRRQLGSVYCDGGVPKVFRFSDDSQFLGAETSVGWYVWRIPSFEKVFVLGDIDFGRPVKAAPGTVPAPPKTKEK